MRRSAAFVFLFFFSAILPAAAADWLQQDAAYSAMRTMRAAGQEVSGPLHHDNGKERFELTVDGQRQVMIRRPDVRRLYMIMPDMGMGMEMSLDAPQAMPSADDYAELKPEKLGEETLNGEAVTKYRIEGNSGGQEGTVLIWVTDDGIPLRMEGRTPEGSFEMVMSDLRRGPQPAGLFEPPAGIQMMAMPGQ
ncbi:DUF4412 domain-containing protein [Pelagibius sp. CAU 1746]|uniref:DUF4412 domain-containing protein n=1 Tax=Pelagibius sp. CAU 1746 TaxID=3140370 RepID=UPI00325B883C